MKWHILVVDESTAFFDRIQAIGSQTRTLSAWDFRMPGLDCEYAESGKMAYRKLVGSHETNRPFALIMIAQDLVGDWDGLETLLRLRQYRSDTACMFLLHNPETLSRDRLQNAWKTGPIALMYKELSQLELGFGIAHYFNNNTGVQKIVKQVDPSGDKRMERIQNLLSKARAENKIWVDKYSELQKAYDSKSEYLTVMSHEIRTPLSSILGVVEIMQNTCLDRKQKDLTEALAESSDTLLSLINDILDMAKIEAGKMTLDLMPFHLEKWLNTIFLMMSDKAEKTNNRLMLRLEPDLPQNLVGDRDKLRQILLNLLGNALKYTRNGTITVAISLMEQYDREIILRFRVIDTGRGIPEGKLDNLFKPFSQIRGGDGGEAGTGLGLVVCKRLVEMMHGSIGVSSSPGDGTEFHFSAAFARYDKETASARPPYQPHPENIQNRTRPEPERSQTILLIEDNPTNQKVASIHLTHAGYRVLTAADGQEGLNVLTEYANEIDLVLMDVQMPVLDGFETTLAIRQMGLNMPVVAITANVFGENRSRCFESGMDDFIAKPIRKKSFLNTISKWLGQQKTAFDAGVINDRTEQDAQASALRQNAKDDPLDYIRVIREFENDRDLVREVLREFLLNTEKKLPVMGRFILDQDYENLEDYAHALKGGGGNLCALPFALAARELEAAAAAADPKQVMLTFMQLQSAFGSLKEFTRTHAMLHL